MRPTEVLLCLVNFLAFAALAVPIPFVLAAAGRAVKHAGQTTLYLTPMHAATGKLLALITNIRGELSHVRAVAEQLPSTDRWRAFLNYVVAKITRPLPPWIAPEQLMATG